MKFDEIHYWSEIKLDIIKDYASAYSQIMSAQRNPTLRHVYIDAFAGAGRHVSKRTGEFVSGSPLNALEVKPPFHEYHLIDIDRHKTAELRRLTRDRPNVHIYEGDCNNILLEKVFPEVTFEGYRRGLCLLDPYGLHLNWEVIEKAGRMKSIDMFLNFPVADMNRNVLWRDPEGVDSRDTQRMNVFWGSESWREIAYTTKQNLFEYPEKVDNETVARGFGRRLQEFAGFRHVADPLPMRNSNGAVVYYLYFASQKLVAGHIIEDLFNKYRGRNRR